MKTTASFIAALLLITADSWAVESSNEMPSTALSELRLDVIVPAEPFQAGAEMTIDVVLSTVGDEQHKLILGSFPETFGLYVLGPWGSMPTRPAKINWMHQQRFGSVEVVVTKDKPLRHRIKLSDYYEVKNRKIFKPGRYQINAKFYAIDWNMPSPIDSGAVRFEVQPRIDH